MKILVSDSVEATCAEILESYGIEVHARPNLSKEEILECIGEYEGLIVRSSTQVTAELIAAGTRLKVVGRAGAGVDNIDVEAATRRGIIVMNTPGGNTISTAEHTMSLLLALARNIPQAHASLQSGKWDRKSYVGTELFGKTIGILGLGKVGREVAHRCMGFGMTVIAYDPMLTPESAAKLRVDLVDFDTILLRSDFISIHVPLTEDTRSLLNHDTLARCKPGVRIINCARGGIVDEAALYDALTNGRVAGAALDVFEKEPPGENRLLQHSKVIATPHLGASTEEAQEKVAIQIAEQVADALLDRRVAGSVNADIIQASTQPEIKPFLELAERMGQFIAQLMDGGLRSIEVTTRGDLLSSSVRAIVAAGLKGIFNILLEEQINYINAPVVARERGIRLSEKIEHADDVYTHLIRMDYETDKERRTMSGTVFGRTYMRIVGIDSFHIEMRPEGNLLVYSNVDQPGVLATVTRLLAEKGLNIADLSLSRRGPGMEALTIINVDSPIPSDLLNQMSGIHGISGVKSVKFE